MKTWHETRYGSSGLTSSDTRFTTGGNSFFLSLIFGSAIRPFAGIRATARSEEHTSELQSRPHLVCRLLLEKTKIVAAVFFFDHREINTAGCPVIPLRQLCVLAPPLLREAGALPFAIVLHKNVAQLQLHLAT